MMKTLSNCILFFLFIHSIVGQKILSGPILLPQNDSLDTYWTLLKNGNKNLFSSSSEFTIMEDTLVSTYKKRYSAFQLKTKNNVPYELKILDQKGSMIYNKMVNADLRNDNVFLFGSCAFIPYGFSRVYRPYKMNRIYRTMAKEEVKKMFWLGDNIYLFPDYITSSQKRIYKSYLKVRKDRSLNTFLSSGIEHHAIWDDHDFGPNNSSGLFENASLTTASFINFWNKFNVKDSGIYEVVRYGKIDFFLMDTRTFYKVNEGSFLGSKQLDWLKESLLSSKAKFKFILFSNQVLNPKTNHETINKGIYSKEKDILLDFIEKQSIVGVVFFSGDRHFSEIHKHTGTNLSYTLYDFTTSPLSSPRHRLFFKEEKKNIETRVQGSFYSNKNYLKCTIQNENKQEVLFFEYKNKFGKTVFQHALSEKELGY